MDNGSGEIPATSQSRTTDWDLCALCQQKTKEKLQCPANARQKSQGSTYVTLTENLLKFNEFDGLPPGLLSRLDEGEGVEETLRKKNASLHLSCRLKYNSTKLKRKLSCCSLRDECEDSGHPRKVTRKELESSFQTGVDRKPGCFLCDKSALARDLRNASTFQLDQKIRNCALLLQDKKLLAKLSTGDVISQELKYHPACLTSLYRRAKPKLYCTDGRSAQMRNGLVFAELTEYMQEIKTSDGHLTVFKLADLCKMYQTRLKEYGIQSGRLHSGRLKTRLLAHFPDLQAHNSGRDVLLTFTDKLNSTLQEAYAESFDDEAVHLAKAARIVRRDLFALKCKFSDSYDEDCQRRSVPESLLALMQMILQGPSITSKKGNCQASLSLAQLASFNAVKTERKRSRCNVVSTKHSKHREPPIPVYVDITIHAQTRKKELVDCMHSLGLSISYKRILEISSELASKACRQFQQDGVVCPMELKFGLFTTAAIDNIDHNPSSTTSKDSFHGTAISIFQHCTQHCGGIERTLSTVSDDGTTSKSLAVAELPEYFTSIPPFMLKMPVEPPHIQDVSNDSNNSDSAIVDQYEYIRPESRDNRTSTAQNPESTNSNQALAGITLGPDGGNNETITAKNPESTKSDQFMTGASFGVDWTDIYNKAVAFEHRWMEAVQLQVPESRELTETDSVSWGAYHAAHSQQHHQTPGISSLLPLFYENSKSSAMIKHAMDLVMNAVKFLNSGQNPVITVDQPLFAIAKQIQWKCPDVYGEDKIIILLGGLHIEMAFLKTIGTILRDSGWVEDLVNAKVATSGTAESFTIGSHVTRSRHAHQLTACALFRLLKIAYDQYLLSCSVMEEKALPYDDWKEYMAKTSPTFHFWFLILQLEVFLLVFISSLREGNFPLYVQALTKMAPWFFALDQQNYARWISVHIRDMEELQSRGSNCHDEFMQGHFVLQKTSRPFSKIALDQAHEQNNAIIKGDGGAVGLTENPSALRRWMIGGPEISRVIKELELSLETNQHSDSADQHHEQSKRFQENFKADVSSLTKVIEETGNPFLERSAELITLHDNNIVDTLVQETLKILRESGVVQYNEFMQERLIKMTKPVSAPIKRNNFTLISGAKRRKRSAKSYNITSLKSDCYLFSRLYIACQTRNGGLEDFFMYENQPAPPSLSCEGRMKTSNKSTLLECLEPLQASIAVPTETDLTILDGAAVVNMLRPGSARTFADYANQIFLPYVIQTLQKVSHRVDIVWDHYRTDSLKNYTRESRGQGKKKRVTPNTVIPAQWGSFLRVDANKIQLFSFLAQCAITIQTEKLIVTTQGPLVLTNHPIDQTGLSPCSHEGADTRIMVHLAHAAPDCKNIRIRTVDTDVVILAVAAMTRHPNLKLWIAMGTGKDFRYIAAHDIASALGVVKAKCLPVFHSFTGCDTVSFFNAIGKKTAWEVWSNFGEATDTFQRLCSPPYELTPSDRAVLERFVTLLYDRTSNCLDVNTARKHMFTKTGRQIDHIPPSSEALFQHCKRAVYQGGHIWSQAHEPLPVLPHPGDWGWQFVEGKWQPFWTILPQASITCRELLKCGCKKSCRNKRCKCYKVGLKCTALCNCGMDCSLTAASSI